MSWLSDYLDYTQYQESPELFHMWTGIMTIASVINRQVWVERGDMGVTWYKVYPGQLMVVIVAPSGRGHKGTAMRLGRQLMEEAGVYIIKGKGSTEKIIDLLAHKASVQINGTKVSSTSPDAIGILIAPELSVLVSKQVYADSLIDFLTDIADADGNFSYNTMKSTVTLKNPCLTFFGGATPRSIGESIPEKAHSTGFTSRVLHVYHNGIERAANSLVNRRKPTDPVKRRDGTVSTIGQEIVRLQFLRKSLVDRLEQMKTLSGRYDFNDAGADWFDKWYHTWVNSPIGQGEGYPTRRPDHLLRLATILRASEDLVPELDDNVLSRADLALTQIEPGFRHAFAEIGRHAIAPLQDKVIECIRKHGGRASTRQIYSQLYRYFHDPNEWRSVMQSLVEAGEVVYGGIVQGKIPQEWWVLVNMVQP